MCCPPAQLPWAALGIECVSHAWEKICPPGVLGSEGCLVVLRSDIWTGDKEEQVQDLLPEEKVAHETMETGLKEQEEGKWRVHKSPQNP